MLDLYQFSVSNALKYSKNQIFDFSLFKNHKTTRGYARTSKKLQKGTQEKSVGNTALQDISYFGSDCKYDSKIENKSI